VEAAFQDMALKTKITTTLSSIASADVTYADSPGRGRRRRHSGDIEHLERRLQMHVVTSIGIGREAWYKTTLDQPASTMWRPCTLIRIDGWVKAVSAQGSDITLLSTRCKYGDDIETQIWNSSRHCLFRGKHD